MGHDASKILFGSTQSSVKEVTCERGDPATFKAGLAVRKATTGALQLADDATAVLIGVSLGPDLSDTKTTAVCRTGNFVPIVILNDAASVKIGDITFTAKTFGALGNSITITLADTETGNVADVDVDGTDIVVGIDGGTTTTTVVVAAIVANAAANALVSCAIDSGDEAAVVAAAVETALAGGSDVAVPGTAVKIDDTTGKASIDGDTTAAMYISGVLTGVYPDGTTVQAAWISMPGGF
jgi:hypothetical protein